MTIPRLSLSLLTAGLLILNPLQSLAQDDMTPQEAAQKFGTLMRYVGQLYVDSVSVEDLTELAIVKMLEDLDPHSVYFSADELKEADEPLNGNFEGIGVQFNIFKDTIMVVSPSVAAPPSAWAFVQATALWKWTGKTRRALASPTGTS